MMKSELILRLDDACPTMAHAAWRQLEAALDALEIKPIVGVIPDCRDPEMLLEEPDPNFWQRVQAWQAKGWTIALHGLHHTYHEDPPGTRALVQFHRRGEFVGLDLKAQRAILKRAWQIFREHDISPTMFMAPSHSFDAATLEALLLETPIHWVTDGISHRPFNDRGLHWLPQQLGRLPNWLPTGTWTLCIHPNTMTSEAIQSLTERLEKHRSRFVAFDCAQPPPCRRGIADEAFASLYWGLRATRSQRARVASNGFRT